MSRLFRGISFKALGLFPGSAAGLEEQLPHVERYETVLPRELPVPRGKRDLSSPPVSHSWARPPSLLSRESGRGVAIRRDLVPPPLDPPFDQTPSALHRKNEVLPISLPCFCSRGWRC